MASGCGLRAASSSASAAVDAVSVAIPASRRPADSDQHTSGSSSTTSTRPGGFAGLVRTFPLTMADGMMENPREIV
jgi:hypothetical protein